MQRHFSQAMDKVEGLINLWSAPSAVSLSDRSTAKVLVAVSGGVDSMCMADLFLRYSGPSAFAVAHCNFHLRGEESDGDEALVRGWAEENGVLCHVTGFDTEAYSLEHGVSIEMAARDLRYAWFCDLCRENGYRAVAVAHNANDNAETLILNLLRGTGIRGLGGMSLVSDVPSSGSAVAEADDSRPKLIRPLLECSRKMIEGYAFAHGISYREDSTNSCTDYKRNRIRNEIFPQFGKINPSFVRTLNREMTYLSDASSIVEQWCLDHLQQVLVPGAPSSFRPSGASGEISISIPRLLAIPQWRYLLYHMLEPYGFNSSVLSSLEDLLDSDRTVSGKRYESDTHMLMTGRGVLTVLPREGVLTSIDEPVMVVRGAGSYVFNGRTFRVEVLPVTDGMSLKQPPGTLVFDAGILFFPFVLRRWRQGDWLVPFGMKGKKKVSDIFADLKYDALAKAASVVMVDTATEGLAEQQHIAGLLGVRIDDRYRISSRTVSVLRITEASSI